MILLSDPKVQGHTMFHPPMEGVGTSSAYSDLLMSEALLDFMLSWGLHGYRSTGGEQEEAAVSTWVELSGREASFGHVLTVAEEGLQG